MDSHDSLDRRFLLGGLAGAAGLAALAAAAKAGPLSPPAGAVASTGKDLTSIEPRIEVNAVNTPGTATYLYHITQPGSYYLSGNIAGVPGKGGVLIEANHVTLDLMGFKIDGGNTPTTLNGINTSGVTTVLNGSITAWAGTGIVVGAGSRLEGLHILSSGAAANVGNYSSITACTALACNQGFTIGSGCTVSRCISSGNNGSGFTIAAGATLDACVSNGNTNYGFLVSTGFAVLRGCNAWGNQSGAKFLGPAMAVECFFANNFQYGIDCATGASVLRSTCAANQFHGINFADRCQAIGNNCTGNGPNSGVPGYGINVTGTGNRIEGNHCGGNTRGINIAAASNIIVRNSVSGNSEFGYSIAANNGFGPNIFNSSGMTSSTNPQSNYEF